MDNVNKITIIMSVYNENNNYLKEAIESILNQTYRNYIFLIVDDGTTLENKNILEEYRVKDKRIKLIKNDKNLGLVKSLNKAIKCVDTKYIARMDSDDISHLNRLEKQLKFMEENEQYAFIGTRANYINETGIYQTSKINGEIYTDMLVRTCMFFHPSIMIKTDIIKQVGMYDEYTRNEDYALYLKMYLEGFKGYVMDDVLLDYRQDRKSFERKKYRDRIVEAKIRNKYFRLLEIKTGKRFIYTIKPLIVGLIPKGMLYRYKLIKNRR